MSISLMTAMVIQSNEGNVRCEAIGPEVETGKWAGVVALYRGDEFHRYVLSSTATFDSPEAAVAAMEVVVAEIRAMDLESLPGRPA